MHYQNCINRADKLFLVGKDYMLSKIVVCQKFGASIRLVEADNFFEVYPFMNINWMLRQTVNTQIKCHRSGYALFA